LPRPLCGLARARPEGSAEQEAETSAYGNTKAAGFFVKPAAFAVELLQDCMVNVAFARLAEGGVRDAPSGAA
jgi:hypothetical protein